MKKSNVVMVVVMAIVGLLIFTNPTVETQRENVKTVLMNGYSQMTKQKIDTEMQMSAEMLGNAFLSQFVSSFVTSNNFILFSITNLEIQGKKKIIGISILNNTFFLPEFKKTIEDINKNV